MLKFQASAFLILGLSLSLAHCRKQSESKSPAHTTAPTSSIPSPDNANANPNANTQVLRAPADTVREASPLTDQSRSLEEVLEKGTLSKDDCDKYFKGQKDRTTTLRCGKWMYFYGHLEVPGSPAKIVDLMREHAPESAGKSLEKFGLIPDPYSKKGLPVGMSEGPDMTANVPTYTLTCSSCHFGQTPDGRYVVGSPNHKFQFGRLTLSIASLPELATQPAKKLPPEVSKVIDPLKNEVFGNGLVRLGIIAEALKLIPSIVVTKISPPNDAAKIELAVLPSGVMDPYSAPSLDDGVRIPVRMSPLWGIDPEAMTKAGSKHGAMLGSNGGAPDLQHIMRTSATISGKIRAKKLGGDDFKADDIMPLVEYILSLQPPKPEKSFDMTKLAAGSQLFQKNCFVCHNGPGFAGTRVFDVKEIGTDPNISRLVDKDNTGKALFGVLTDKELTKGIRARRLSAVWSMERLFHNGSSGSLAEVFCLDGPRKDSGLGSGYSSAGHTFTCEALSRPEKESLIHFLESL